MSSECENQVKHKRGLLLPWLAALFMLHVVYVLSTGPMIKFSAAGYIQRSTVMGLYRPLMYLSEQNKVAERFFDWYIGGLWGVD